MQPTNILEEMQSRLSQLLAQTPAKDIEKNVRALMQQGFAKLDLATREQLDLQSDVLARTRAKLTELEARVAELEKNNTKNPA
jgi:BMFP domain-containing protein YqiC